MMRLLNSFCAFLLLFTVCCTQKSDRKAERITVDPVVVMDELYMTRLWSMLLMEKHIILQPSSKDEGFMEIYDYNGTFVGQIGNTGGGPGEYTSPNSVLYGKDGFFIWDNYTDQLPSICKVENRADGPLKLDYITVPFRTKEMNAIQTDLAGNFIVYDPEKEDIITVYSSDGKKLASGGKLPYPANVSNKREAYYGNIWYNSYNKKLLLSFGNLPYVAIYKVDEKKVALEFEKHLAEKEYSIQDGAIVFNDYGENCKTMCCLTKEYIICVENDGSYTGTDRSITSPMRHTISVYDYKFNLVKILDMQRTRMNVTAKGNDNSFYALVLNPENCIVRVDL